MTAPVDWARRIAQQEQPGLHAVERVGGRDRDARSQVIDRLEDLQQRRAPFLEAHQDAAIGAGAPGPLRASHHPQRERNAGHTGALCAGHRLQHDARGEHLAAAPAGRLARDAIEEPAGECVGRCGRCAPLGGGLAPARGVGKESLAAGPGAGCGRRAGPLREIDLERGGEQEPDDASVGCVVRVRALVSFDALCAAVSAWKDDHGIELAAPLHGAAMGGRIGALAQKVARRIQDEAAAAEVGAEEGHVGGKEGLPLPRGPGQRRIRRATERVGHGSEIIIGPLVATHRLGEQPLPEVGPANQRREDGERSAAAQDLVVFVVAGRVGVPEQRERRARIGGRTLSSRANSPFASGRTKDDVETEVDVVQPACADRDQPFATVARSAARGRRSHHRHAS